VANKGAHGREDYTDPDDLAKYEVRSRKDEVGPAKLRSSQPVNLRVGASRC
jgi:hypothetical protein